MAFVMWTAATGGLAAQQSTPPPPAAPAPAAPAAAPQSHIPESVKARETITNDSDAEARVDNEPLDPTLAGFFLIPGTSTRLKFGGFARVDVIHDFEPIGNHDEFQVSSIPIDSVSGADNTQIQARQTRFDFELRRSSALGTSDLRMLFEFDFFGSQGERALNLRHAYGQLVNVLAGFTTSTLQDVDARPDMLDHEGPPARVSQRSAQLRYTFKLPHVQSLAFAVEEPRADLPAIAAGQPVTDFTPWPDLVVRYRVNPSDGHLQIGGVLRSIGGFAGNGTQQQQVTGAGMSASGSILLRKRDTVLIEVNGGRGIARYIKDLAGQGLDAALDDNGRARALGVGTGIVSFQHMWTDRLRSTAAFSLDRIENLNSQPADTYRQGTYAGVNLLYKPAPAFTVGIEYDYGRLEVKDGRRNSANRIQLAVQYDLVK